MDLLDDEDVDSYLEDLHEIQEVVMKIEFGSDQIKLFNRIIKGLVSLRSKEFRILHIYWSFDSVSN
jgi:hypothetical protein